MKIDSLKKDEHNKNVFYKIKNYMISMIQNNSSSKYLYLFILGDNRYLKKTIKDSYQKLGISHLFSVSGMHISIISGIVLSVLKKFKISEEKRYVIVSIFISFYMFLVGFCPSVLRSGIFFILLSINTIFYFNIKPINILLLTISIILLFNPFIIYNTGFLYSSIITASLIIFGNLINEKKNYLMKLLYTSVIAFFFSLPISLYNYYSFNLLTIFYNLLFVPLVSLIVFPLSLICFLIRPLSFFLNGILVMMESLALKLALIKSDIIVMKPNLLIVVLYYLLIFLMFKYRKKFFYFSLLILFISHYNYNLLFPSNYMIMIDVGQGDSILLHSGEKNILIDTGGKYGSNYDMASGTLIPLFKSLGIRKIDFLFLSHGDYDHVGETINLINNFKVMRVFFNEGNINYNEKMIIDVLEKKNIYYNFSRKDDFYKIGNYQIYSLGCDLDDENDSSLILYGEIFNNNFLLMGDASKHSETVLLDSYDLPKIDILKVGHHGSKTSTSQELLTEIKPDDALISVGSDNKFGHPNRETIDILNDNGVNIHMTSNLGAIWINFKKNVTNFVNWT